MKLLQIAVYPLAVLSAACYVPAFAASPQERADSVRSLQEVSVTAIKNSSVNAGGQPVAVTVVGQDEISKLNIVTMKQVSDVAPNFYVPDYGSRMTSSIYVRGLGARIDQPVIGLNVDNVPILNKDNYDFDLIDIDRIDVMRGPQSTLYGRNTMGGVVNIRTLSPMNWQGLRLNVAYGSANTARAAVSYYKRFDSTLGMAWIADFSRTDGYFRNVDNGRKTDRERQGSLRWKSVWRAAPSVMMENTLAVNITRQGGYPYQSVGTGEINYNDTCFYRRTGVTDGLTLRWVTDRFVLSGISSVQYLDDNMTLDQDFTPLDYFTLSQKRKELALTQDVVVKSTGRGIYGWLAGVFGFYKHTRMEAPVVFKDYGIRTLIENNRNQANPYYPIRWNDDSFLLGSRFVMPVWGVALYHQSAFDLGRWSLTAGVRVDYERARLDYHSECLTSYTTWNCTGDEPVPLHVVDVDIDDGGHLEKSFVELLPKITVSYALPVPEPSSLYASVSKGYKSGGFNTQMFSDVLQQRVMEIMGLGMKYTVDQIISYKPEKSWNYEVGAHVACAGGKVRTDLSLFYIDCRDQQLTMFPPGTVTGRIMTNAGRTRSSGAECAIVLSPDSHWTIRASYGFTDARFVTFDNGREDYAGKRIPYAPRHTAFASVGYRRPVSSGWVDAVGIDINAKGTGSIYWNEENTLKQPFYAQLGAMVRLERGDCSLDVWGENLTGCNFDTFYFVSIGNAFLQKGKPRRMGVTLRLNFESL